MAPCNDVLVGGQPQKSPLDKRFYRILTLANDLKVFLASEPGTEVTAVALDVGVGSFSDPKDLPGLAHFCEHMLFMGTAKYPEEKDFADYVAKHGGSSNAYTASEHTNYHFEIAAKSSPSDGEASSSVEGDEDVFFEALDRFAQFFVAPLFTESGTDRELDAVDHEHSRNLLNDRRRLMQVQAACSNPLHPYSFFSTGSRKTLRDMPAERGIDVRAALLEFHRRYYSSNLMHLCVAGPQSLDRMQEVVVELFGNIENKSLPSPEEEYSAIEPLTDAEMGCVISAKTVEEWRELELYWLLPPTRPASRSTAVADDVSPRAVGDAVDYISDVLGHEGSGSLTSYLKAKGWIDDLSTGSAGSYSSFSWFNVTIDLTVAGVERVDDVVASVFGFLRLIGDDGIHEWIHDELVTLEKNAFRFAARCSPSSLTSTVSRRMAFRLDEELLCGPWLAAWVGGAEIRRVLGLLNPSRMTLALSGDFVGDVTNTREPIYGTKYCVKSIPELRLAAWQTALPTPEMVVRRPNPFISTDFSIAADTEKSSVDESATGKESLKQKIDPVTLVDSNKFELYHVLDRVYRRPKASVHIFFTTDELYGTAVSRVSSSFALALIRDDLSELAYEAGLACLNYALSSTLGGIFLSVGGYNERLDSFLVEILKRVVSFRASPARYRVIKDQFEMGWRNNSQKSPSQHASSQIDHYCEEPSWPASQLLTASEGDGVSLDTVNEFLDNMLRMARAIVLVTGNVSEEWALAVPRRIEECVTFVARPHQHLCAPRVAKLPEGVETWARMKVPNEKEENSAMEVLFQVGQHSVNLIQLDASLEILVAIIKTPFFEELRTKQQLGYIVSATLDCWRNVYGVSFMIQGKKASPAQVRARLDAFLHTFRTTLVDMTECEFQKYVDSEVAVRGEPDQTFSARVARIFPEIMTTREYVYDRQNREVQALRGVSKDDVIALFDHSIREGSPTRRVFTSCAYGMNHELSDDDAALNAMSDRILLTADRAAFKETLEFYPSQGGICKE